MDVLLDALTRAIVQISEPPGAYVYHLVALFAIESAGLMALVGWWRRSGSGLGRLALALNALFILHLVGLVAVLLGAFGLLNPVYVVPPLTRGITAATLAIVLWITLAPNGSRWVDAFTALLLAAIGIGLALTWPDWIARAGTVNGFNATPYDALWSYAQTGAAALGLLWLVIRRPARWGLSLLLIGLLLIGHALHIILFVQQLNVAGVTRLVELIAYPLFLAFTVGAAPLAAQPAPPVAAATDAKATPSAEHEPRLNARTANALASLGLNQDLPQLAQALARAAGLACDADVALVISPPDGAGMTSLLGAYEKADDLALPGTLFEGTALLRTRVALAGGTPVHLNPASAPEELQALVGAAGLSQIGPGLVAAIHAPGAVGDGFGAIVLVNTSGRDFTDADTGVLTSLLGPARAALRDVDGDRLALEREIERLTGELNRAEEARRATRVEADQLSVALDNARGEAGALHESILELRESLAERAPEAKTDAAALGGATFAAALGAVNAVPEAELQQLRDLAAAAESELNDLQERAEATERELSQARAEAEALREIVAGAQAETTAWHERVTTAEGESARLAQLAQTLQARLEERESSSQKTKPIGLTPPPPPALEDERALHRSEVESLREQLETQQWKAATRQLDYEFLLSQEKDLKVEVDALRAQLAGLQATGQALEGGAEGIGALQLELGRLSQALAAANDQLAARDREVERLQGERLNRATDELLGAQARVAQLEATLAERTAAAQAAPAGLTRETFDVIASVIQELRQPMSTIRGYSDLLLGESVGMLGALQRKFLERVTASCERMEVLVDDLMRVTDLDSGALRLDPQRIDVLYVVDDAIHACAAQYREKGLNLRLDIADDLPTVVADRDAVRQILTHLLQNAGAASPADGAVLLRIRDHQDGERSGPFLFVSVTDSGSGIPADDQARVFSRMYRADSPLVTGLGETGVGLALAKALTQAQGGKIWFTSEPSRGTTFHVLLPIRPAPSGGVASGNATNGTRYATGTD
ncbi:MAG: hypothetical protein JNL73_20875 [Anaerolineales bacterium]|nr:hypothetical protein [Anaerolineales bacterium]